MLKIGKIKMSGGFLFLAALFFYLDDQWMLVKVLMACLFHEFGHWAAICWMGGRVQELSLTAVGAELRLDRQRQMSYGGEIISTLAGPGVNLLLAVVCAAEMPVFSGINLMLGLFNLLPVMPLDGGRLFYIFLTALWTEDCAERVSRILSMLFSLFLLGAGGLILWKGGHNFTLLLIAGWLWFLLLRRKRVANRKRNG